MPTAPPEQKITHYWERIAPLKLALAGRADGSSRATNRNVIDPTLNKNGRQTTKLQPNDRCCYIKEIRRELIHEESLPLEECHLLLHEYREGDASQHLPELTGGDKGKPLM